VPEPFLSRIDTTVRDRVEARIPSATVDSTTRSFWDLIGKQNDPTTAALVAKVSDPDPDDENDPFPLSFPLHISMYSLAKYNMDVSGARTALFNNYNGLQSELSTNVYSQSEVAAWTTSPTSALTQTCTQLDAVKRVAEVQLATLKQTMRDLSGTEVSANAMKNENMALQLKLSGLCQGVTPPTICQTLASQDGPLFPLLSKYEAADDALAANETDIQNTLQTINDTYSVLGCISPNFSFDGDKDAGYVNTEELRINLQRISPYYVSPDTLKYITNAMVPGGKQLSTPLSTTADMIIDINRVIKNIKFMTNTT